MIKRGTRRKPTPRQESPSRRVFIRQAAPPHAPVALVTKVKHAAQAGVRIVRRIREREPIRVSAEVLKQRDDACNACDLWKPEGNLGMGE